ncbi:hypothetical protein DF3PA_210011 [Candidatus Defluviicoccus seviourii]|uniref:Uncharacterized protein n=1 Tax=Candidatus Defluviicoccus seviourii TaxID=2565273 RepID=A0A564WEI2_9PROT|nr:hypothetical protein DF3PA_210011 [Candidatus Defluviicoccus seviourii]
MGRDDTYPLDERRIRIPFRDMTTAEAEHQVQAIWPYLDGKVTAILAEKLSQLERQYSSDDIITAIANLMELSAATPENARQIRAAFRLLRLAAATQTMFTRICFRCFLPWVVALIAGATGMIVKENSPALTQFIEKLKLLQGP